MNGRRVWPLAVGAPKDVEVLKYIHPLKQKAVYKLLEHTKTLFSDVDALVIFGSSVTPMCNIYSDVDVVVVGGKNFYTPEDYVYDVVRVDDMDPNCGFIQRLLGEGVVVYDKQSAS